MKEENNKKCGEKKSNYVKEADTSAEKQPWEEERRHDYEEEGGMKGGGENQSQFSSH